MGTAQRCLQSLLFGSTVRIIGAMSRFLFVAAAATLFFTGGIVAGRSRVVVVHPAAQQSSHSALEALALPRTHEPVLEKTGMYCDDNASFYAEEDRQLCLIAPKLSEFRLFEINLTRNRILFYENGLLQKTLPVAYQAPYGIWYQTPTGYFRFGVKRPRFMSSIVPVYMEKAVQLYEDFFIHGIPYYADGTRVTSQFSGGCIRLEDSVAEDFYNLVRPDDAVVSYATLENMRPKAGFTSPVAKDGFWIRQRFNSPLKTDWSWHQDKRDNYIQHAGLDLAPLSGTADRGAYAVLVGAVEAMVVNGVDDKGMGNTVIVRHDVDGEVVYSLYAHLESFERYLRVGDRVNAGDRLGIVGNTGFGCSYWRIGDDGCDGNSAADTHLHLEIKSEPMLTSPIPDTCMIPTGKQTACVGYASHRPQDVGYQDPLLFVFEPYKPAM